MRLTAHQSPCIGEVAVADVYPEAMLGRLGTFSVLKDK